MEKTVNHILLRAVSISVATYTPDSGVGRAKVARYMECSQKTVAKRLEELIASGHIVCVKVSANRGHGFKYLYNLTPKGCQYLEDNWERVNADYQAWQNQRLLAEMAIARRPIKGKKSKKQINQEKAGQKELF